MFPRARRLGTQCFEVRAATRLGHCNRAKMFAACKLWQPTRFLFCGPICQDVMGDDRVHGTSSRNFGTSQFLLHYKLVSRAAARSTVFDWQLRQEITEFSKAPPNLPRRKALAP